VAIAPLVSVTDAGLIVHVVSSGLPVQV